jgi:hypothetical protein
MVAKPALRSKKLGAGSSKFAIGRLHNRITDGSPSSVEFAT